MSSLLKALKQQQSPLVNQGSDIDPALLAAQPVRWWIPPVFWSLLVVVILALSGALVWQWLDDNGNRDEAVTVPTTAVDFQLGKTAAVEPITWSASAPATPPTTAGGAESNNDPQPSVQPSANREPLDLNQVSPELLAKFEQAIAASDYDDGDSPMTESRLVPPLAELAPEFKRQVPAFSYDGHMYVSDATQRWVELNKQRLYLNEQFGGVKVERIEPQQLILSVNGKAFSVEALQDWSGQ